MFRDRSIPSRSIRALALACVLIGAFPSSALATAPASVSHSETLSASFSPPYPVSDISFLIMMSSGKEALVTVYYPGYSGRIERLQRISEGPFPTVVFSPGMGASAMEYEDALVPLAACGLVVAGVGWDYENDREKDVAYKDHSKVIDEIKSMGENYRSPLYKLPDTTNCGAFGHSRGGRTAFMASSVEPRIKAIGAWMPTLDNGSAVAQSIPKSLFSGSKDDTAPPDKWQTPLYDSCRPSIVYVELYGGDHGVEPGVHVNITISFFKYHLLNDKAAETDVYGDGIKKRAESGEFRLRMKTESGEYDSSPNSTVKNVAKSSGPSLPSGVLQYAILPAAIGIAAVILWFLDRKGLIRKKQPS